jgi:hypothetical protein
MPPPETFTLDIMYDTDTALKQGWGDFEITIQLFKRMNKLSNLIASFPEDFQKQTALLTDEITSQY